MGRITWQMFTRQEGQATLANHWLIEFLFPHRLHRLEFFLRLLAADLFFIIFQSCVNAQGGPYFWGPYFVVNVYVLLFVVVPRFRDIGMRWWWVLGLIPPANFVFGTILMFHAPSYRPPAAVSEPLAATA